MSLTDKTDAGSFISAFKALTTVEARRSAYQSILAELKPGEWRDLRQLVNARTFPYDIFGSLPVELATQICSYLNPVDIISTRRVSKRWKELMSLPFICSAAFRRLNPAGIPLDTSNLGWETFFANRVKRRHAVNTGRPYSKATYSVKDGNFHNSGYYPDLGIAYCSGKLAWLDRRAVTVLCLKTGKRSSFSTENREPIEYIEISELIVAAITSRSVCHVWDLHGSQSHTIRLPSLKINQVDVFRYKVIIHVDPGSLLVWDFETQVTLETPLLESPNEIVFNRAGNRFCTIHIKYATDDSVPSGFYFRGVTFSEYQINGTNILRSGDPSITALDDYRVKWCKFLRRARPDINLIMTQRLRTKGLDMNTEQRPTLTTRQILFDFSSGVTKSSAQIYPMEKNTLVNSEFIPINACSISIPGDLIYQICRDFNRRSPNHCPEVVVHDVRSSTYYPSEIASIERGYTNGGWADMSSAPNREPFLYGDDEFLCLVEMEKITVYSFDENVHMAGEDGRYRTNRNQRARERLQRIRQGASERSLSGDGDRK